MPPSTDVDLIDADLHALGLFFLSYVDFDGLQSHSVGLFKWKVDFLLIIFDSLLQDLFHLDEAEPAHEAEGSSLEGNDGRNFNFELFCGIEDGTISSDGDDEGDEVIVLAGDKLKAGEFLMLSKYFRFGACVCEVVECLGELGDDADGLFDGLENLLLFVDATDHQNGQHLILHL